MNVLKWILRGLAGLLVLCLLCIGIAFLVPTSRYFLVGAARGESFDSGMPSSYWISTLDGVNEEQRLTASKALSNIGAGAPNAVASLGKGLKASDPVIRVNCACALLKIGPAARTILPELIEALKDELPLIRMDAVLIMARIGPDAKDAVPSLIQAHLAPNNREFMIVFANNIRRQAVVTLGRIGPNAAEAVPTLIRAIQDSEDPDMRLMALDSLQQIDAAAAARIALP